MTRTWATRGRKYAWTPALDQWLRDSYRPGAKGLSSRLAAQRGWPRWVITHRAQILGLCRVKELPWSEAQVAFLEAWSGARSVQWIARQPVMRPRTVTAIVVKTKRLGIARGHQPGLLSMRKLELCLGTDHRRIADWVRTGLLVGVRKGTDRLAIQGGDIWVFLEADVLRFLLHHPREVCLQTVDQEWFLGIVQRLYVAAGERLEPRARQYGTPSAWPARDRVRVRPATDRPVGAPAERRAPDVTRQVTPPAATLTGTRPCAVCGQPLPPRRLGRPRLTHEGCGRPPAALRRVWSPPAPAEDFDVVWDGRLDRQGTTSSLVGNIQRTGHVFQER